MSTGSRHTTSTEDSARCVGTGKSSTNRKPDFNKKQRKIVRILTVVGYIISVSIVAVVLSAYYVFLWVPTTSSTSSSHLASITNQSSDGVSLAYNDERNSIYMRGEPTENPEDYQGDQEGDKLDDYGTYYSSLGSPRFDSRESTGTFRSENGDINNNKNYEATRSNNHQNQLITKPYQPQQIPTPQSRILANMLSTTPISTLFFERRGEQEERDDLRHRRNYKLQQKLKLQQSQKQTNLL